MTPEDTPDISTGSSGDSNDPGLAKLNLWLEVSADQMKASLSGQVEGRADRRQAQLAITNLVREEGIKHGLSVQDIKHAVDSLVIGDNVENLVIARGTPFERGQDAHIEVLVPIGEEERPAQRNAQQDKVDFRDRGRIPVVEKGTPMAVLTPAQPGNPGRDVRGNLVQPPAVRLLKLKKGRGIVLEQDDMVAVAAVRGMAHRPEVDTFEVQEILVIKGDVDFQVGHVDFPGVVRVAGSVLPDFRVRAHTLEVEILETGSEVEVVADITVRGGIMGAIVQAGGKVTARYVSQSQVIAGGDVVVENEIVGSEVDSKGKLGLTASEGRIVDSKISAIRGVSVAKILSSGSPTIIRIGVSAEFEQKLNSARRAVAMLNQERKQLMEFLQAQEEELNATEDELRTLLAHLNDPSQALDRDNLVAQVQMIKPLRLTLKEGLTQGRSREQDITYELQRLSEKVAEMEALLPTGNIWLDVRNEAEAGTEIKTPHAAVTLEINSKAFSAREVVSKDKETGNVSYGIKLGPLRSGAS